MQTQTYVALLRGINVGGKNIIKMAEIKLALKTVGLHDVRTYIQSGNIIYSTDELDTAVQATIIEHCLQMKFKIISPVAVFSKTEWQKIIVQAPADWGHDITRKHNLLVLLKPYDMTEVVAAIGELQPNVESLTPGEGVLYQAISLELVGRTTTSKLTTSPIYKRMTIRNYSTAVKLLKLL